MSLALDDPDVRPRWERLAPYARFSLEEAGRYARRLHAEELAVEHLVSSLLFDEESAAARVVLHAFADPETIATEMLALCPGILVVGSERCLPFSAGGVRVLAAARAGAAAEAAAAVEPAHLLAAAARELPPDARERLAELGFRAPPSGGAPAPEPVAADGPVLAAYSGAAKRAVGASATIASELGRSAVSPAHLLLGALRVDADLARASGLPAPRARAGLAGLDADPTPLPPRALRADEGLLAFLDRLPAGADTLELLGCVLDHGALELRQLLARQKVTAAVVERCRGAIRDPEPPSPGGARGEGGLDRAPRLGYRE